MEQGVEILKTLHYLSTLIQGIKNPMGSRENPARICRDLLNCEQKVADGNYWIDPNLGCSSDSIDVFCNFTVGGQTCLKPLAMSKLDFGVGKIQMNFLHLLSSEAVQPVTVHCRGGPAWEDPKSPHPHRHAARFRAWSGRLYEPGGLLEPRVLNDGCRMDDGKWHKTEFLFTTQDVNHLPIVDVHFTHQKPNSQYHLEVGPVCFL